MTPFSLADLGLSEDEIASMNSLGAPQADMPATPAPPEEEDFKIAPFSMSDLGLSDEEMAGLESLQSESNTRPTTPAPRSPSPSAPDTDMDLPDMSDLPLDLQPFSMDELDLGSADTSSAGVGDLPPSLQPFSLDDPPPPRPRVSGFISPETAENESAADEEDFTPETRGYSWQQATQKPGTSFLKPPRNEPPSSEAEGSIFAKLKQRHLSNPEQREPEPLPPVTLNEDEHLGLFSVDDISLRDDTTLPPNTPAPAAAPESPAARQAPPSTPAEPTASGQASSERAAGPGASEIENLQDALAAGQVQPFSLADLGLSEEEIAAMGIGEAPTAEPEASAAPAPEIENLQDALAAGQVQPFSLADLGLSEEEIAAMGIGEAPTAEPEAPRRARGVCRPRAGDREPPGRAGGRPGPALLARRSRPLRRGDRRYRR